MPLQEVLLLIYSCIGFPSESGLSIDELYLTTVFIYIASRHDLGGTRGFDIHNRTWAYLQELISDLVFGKDASVGAVEALLLLSDNPPREVVKNGAPGSAQENRMSWMIVGTAVRLGYMLALDQTTLVPNIPKAPDTAEGRATMEKLDRDRTAWTYCYIFDRQISIRTGKAFWSRGPGLCFTGSSAESFPSMTPVPGMQDDFASLILAYVEITQTMTNAHDILASSACASCRKGQADMRCTVSKPRSHYSLISDRRVL